MCRCLLVSSSLCFSFHILPNFLVWISGYRLRFVLSLMEFLLIEVALGRVLDKMSFHNGYRTESKFPPVNKTRTIHGTIVEYLTVYWAKILYIRCTRSIDIEIIIFIHVQKYFFWCTMTLFYLLFFKLLIMYSLLFEAYFSSLEECFICFIIKL